MVGETQGDVVLAQEVEDRRFIPARMPELERVAPLRGKHREEGGEPLPVHLHARRQLEQDWPGLVA
jgi:hypothetical protein